MKKYLIRIFEPKELQIFYYAAYPAEGTREYDLKTKHDFFTFLKKGLNFTVRKKPLKRIKIHTEIGDGIKEKGDMDVEITIDAVRNMNNFDTMVLFSGDSDFLALIRSVRNAGKKAYIFSSMNNISMELKTGGDGYVDVLKIDDDIWGRKLKYRNEK